MKIFNPNTCQDPVSVVRYKNSRKKNTGNFGFLYKFCNFFWYFFGMIRIIYLWPDDWAIHDFIPFFAYNCHFFTFFLQNLKPMSPMIAIYVSFIYSPYKLNVLYPFIFSFFLYFVNADQYIDPVFCGRGARYFKFWKYGQNFH